MPADQGNLSLLKHPIAEELLSSSIPARLAYNWTDGTPRVVPIWFHWDGEVFVMGSPLNAPKMKALASNSQVALTIDDITFPYKILQVRGSVNIETVKSPSAEYASCAKRYLGDEVGQGFVDQFTGMFPEMARITITPKWASVIDLVERFPSAWES
jgi:hypothetical protein